MKEQVRAVWRAASPRYCMVRRDTRWPGRDYAYPHESRRAPRCWDKLSCASLARSVSSFLLIASLRRSTPQHHTPRPSRRMAARSPCSTCRLLRAMTRRISSSTVPVKRPSPHYWSVPNKWLLGRHSYVVNVCHMC